MPLTFDLFVEVVGWLEVRGPGQGDHLVPHLVGVERLEQPHASVTRTAGLLHRVVFRVPGQFEHVLGQADRFAGPSHVEQVATEPFVVVSEVVDLVWQHAISHHVGVVDPGRGFLLKAGILVPFQSRINVPGHVPHVGDSRGGLSTAGGGIQRLVRLLVVPQVDTKVVAGVHRILG